MLRGTAPRTPGHVSFSWGAVPNLSSDRATTRGLHGTTRRGRMHPSRPRKAVRNRILFKKGRKLKIADLPASSRDLDRDPRVGVMSGSLSLALFHDSPGESSAIYKDIYIEYCSHHAVVIPRPESRRLFLRYVVDAVEVGALRTAEN